MIKAMSAYLKDESAAAAIEYGVIVALISITLIAVMVQVGIKFNEVTMHVSKTISAVLDRINGTHNN